MNRFKRILNSFFAAVGLAAIFNTNASAGHVTVAHPTGPNPLNIGRRNRGFRTGIKSVASSNNTRFGAALKFHFDQQRAAAKSRKAAA